MDTPSRDARMLASYAGFAFALGFGWFILAPLIPMVGANFHVSLEAALLLISLYGYAMIAGSLPAGFWAARRGPGPLLRLAIVLTVTGLFLRAVAPGYPLFFGGQLLAALAYPFLIAPIGGVLRVAGVKSLRTATGLVIGTLFFGMAVGALLGGHLPPLFDLWLAVIVAVLGGLWLWDTLPHLPPAHAVELGPVRLVVSAYWVIGLVVASVSVMMGSVASAALTHLRVARAVPMASLLTALIFLGSALGASLFGAISQHWRDTRGIQRVLGVLTLVFVMAAAALLTGVLPVGRSPGIDAIFFLVGVFGNGWYALALEAAAQEAADAGSAGLATAGYSLASNVGVAIIPTVLGPLVVAAAAAWFALTALMTLVAAAVPFVIRRPGRVMGPGGAA